MSKNNNGGFTLIELLVAIVIVGIVFTIVITSTAIIRKNARDAQRQSDLRSIQGSLEQYKADQLYYPLPGTANGQLAIGAPLKSPDGTKTYTLAIPTDPLAGNSSYTYGAWAFNDFTSACDNLTKNCNWYLLCAKLENPPKGSTAPNCASGYNFQLTPP